MQQPISLDGVTYAYKTGDDAEKKLGDSNGIILTNLPTNELKKGGIGDSLGIGNLGANTYFIGNNYSFKATSGSELFDSATVIARADGAKAKILSNTSTYTTKIEPNIFNMKWEPNGITENGTVTGTMTYSTKNKGKFYTTSTSLTVPKNMFIGFVAATGDNYSQMKVKISRGQAVKAKIPAYINYVNSVTGQRLAPSNQKWEPSTVNATIGDTLSVVAPNTSTNTSDFIAPEAPEGYTLDSISKPITIQNFAEGTRNPNIITVSYKPQPQSGSVKFEWASDVPGQSGVPGKLKAALPAKIDLEGYTDAPMQQFSPAIPDGYVISMVKGNGRNYTDETIPGLTALEAALKDNPMFVNGVNDFLITLSAKTQDVNFSVSFDNDGSQTPPDNPGTRTITQALTGAVIDDTAINATQEWFDNWVKTQAKGWRLESYVDPKDERYISNLKAAITGAGGYVLPESNDYKAILSYNGALTFEEVPSQIDFGTNPISTKHQTYTAKLDQSLKIADTRGKNSLSKWDLTVRESSPIQEVNAKQNGISFANCLFYGDKALNSDDTLIYKADNPSDGETTVIDKSKTSPIRLSVPVDKQKTNTKFSGTITWTLSSTP